MTQNQAVIERVEQILKRFEIPSDDLGFEERTSLLFLACNIIEKEMADFTGDLHYVRKLFAYIIANQLYQYAFDTMVKLDGMNATIKMSFFEAYKLAKIGYSIDDQRLQKFVDELVYIVTQSGDQVLLSELMEEKSRLSLNSNP